LVCCLKGMWVHPYIITLAKLAPDFGIQAHLWSENDAIMSRFRLIFSPQTTSYIHIRHIKSVWAIVMLSQGHVGATLYPYPGQVGPIFGKSGSLEEWEWCHNVIVEADFHLSLLQTSILDIQSVCAIGMLSQRSMGAPLYSYTNQAGTRFGDSTIETGG